MSIILCVTTLLSPAFSFIWSHINCLPISSLAPCFILQNLDIQLPLKMCVLPIQFSSIAQSCLTLCNPWTEACQTSLSIINSWSLPKLMLVMPSNHLILYCPLLLPPSIFSSIRVFSNESTLHSRWPKYWSFSFNINPFNEHSGLIPFRMDWLDLFAVQGTQESFPAPQFRSIKSSAFSFLYSPTLTSIHVLPSYRKCFNKFPSLNQSKIAFKSFHQSTHILAM